MGILKAVSKRLHTHTCRVIRLHPFCIYKKSPHSGEKVFYFFLIGDF